MRNKLIQFMYGRYGQDELNRFLSAAACVCAILSFFIFTKFMSFLTYSFLFISIYRMLSKRFAERQAENRAYLGFRDRLGERFPALRRRGGSSYSNYSYSNPYSTYSAPSKQAKDRTKKIYKCPECRQKVRVPKGKGNIMITCPKCSTQFKKRT